MNTIHHLVAALPAAALVAAAAWLARPLLAVKRAEPEESPSWFATGFEEGPVEPAAPAADRAGADRKGRGRIALVAGALALAAAAAFAVPALLASLNPPVHPEWTDVEGTAEPIASQNGEYASYAPAADEYSGLIAAESAKDTRPFAVSGRDAVLVRSDDGPPRLVRQECRLVPDEGSAMVWFPGCGARSAIVVPKSAGAVSGPERRAPAGQEAEAPSVEQTGPSDVYDEVREKNSPHEPVLPGDRFLGGE